MHTAQPSSFKHEVTAGWDRLAARICCITHVEILQNSFCGGVLKSTRHNVLDVDCCDVTVAERVIETKVIQSGDETQQSVAYPLHIQNITGGNVAALLSEFKMRRRCRSADTVTQQLLAPSHGKYWVFDRRSFAVHFAQKSSAPRDIPVRQIHNAGQNTG